MDNSIDKPLFTIAAGAFDSTDPRILENRPKAAVISIFQPGIEQLARLYLAARLANYAGGNEIVARPVDGFAYGTKPGITVEWLESFSLRSIQANNSIQIGHNPPIPYAGPNVPWGDYKYFLLHVTAGHFKATKYIITGNIDNSPIRVETNSVAWDSVHGLSDAIDKHIKSLTQINPMSEFKLESDTNIRNENNGVIPQFPLIVKPTLIEKKEEGFLEDEEYLSPA